MSELAHPVAETHAEFHARTRTPTWDCYMCGESRRQRKADQVARNRAAGQKRRMETLAKKKKQARMEEEEEQAVMEAAQAALKQSTETMSETDWLLYEPQAPGRMFFLRRGTQAEFIGLEVFDWHVVTYQPGVVGIDVTAQAPQHVTLDLDAFVQHANEALKHFLAAKGIRRDVLVDSPGLQGGGVEWNRLPPNDNTDIDLVRQMLLLK